MDKSAAARVERPAEPEPEPEEEIVSPEYDGEPGYAEEETAAPEEPAGEAAPQAAAGETPAAAPEESGKAAEADSGGGKGEDKDGDEDEEDGAKPGLGEESKVAKTLDYVAGLARKKIDRYAAVCGAALLLLFGALFCPGVIEFSLVAFSIACVAVAFRMLPRVIRSTDKALLKAELYSFSDYIAENTKVMFYALIGIAAGLGLLLLSFCIRYLFDDMLLGSMFSALAFVVMVAGTAFVLSTVARFYVVVLALKKVKAGQKPRNQYRDHLLYGTSLAILALALAVVAIRIFFQVGF